jgi:multiple sugar transport system ATP-binding protein
MARITLDRLTKVYSDGTKALTALSLEIADGELVVFVGPSGCGKTTALRMVAGLEEVTSGTVTIGDRVVNNLPPKERDIAMVFQNYALYPHMSAYDNMAFGLRRRRVDKREIDRRVREAAHILGLEDVLRKKPGTLSGGQRQRVAMGRAIVREPQAFLMDEPLSNLDAKLRVQMRAEIARIQRDLRVTTIYVTHDQSEAMTLGDRVCVLRGGFLQQVDTPQVVYERPVNMFVAAFIGSPAMNLLEATLVESSDGLRLVFGSQELALPGEAIAARPDLRAYVGRRLVVGMRPEDLRDASLDSAGKLVFEAEVDIREDMGSEVYLHFDLDAPIIEAEDVAEAHDEVGEGETAPPRQVSRLVARLGRETQVRDRERIRLAIAPRLLHFFDAETGEGVYGLEHSGRQRAQSVVYTDGGGG